MHDAQEAARSELLKQTSRLGVHNVSPLTAETDGRIRLSLELDINGQRIPVRVLLPVAFPYGEIEIFVESAEWHRFPHQNAEGKICPAPDALTSRGPERLTEAIEAASEWLNDAHTGVLTSDDERYELPDFPGQRKDWRLLFDEEAADGARWATRVGMSGVVVLAEQTQGWAPEEFRISDGEVVAKRSTVRAPFSAERLTARWILVPQFAPSGHRAARSWTDLREVASGLDDQLYRAWRDADGDNAVVLVGAPIRDTWAGLPTRIHWQPIVFPSCLGARSATKRNRHERRAIRKKQQSPTELWKTSAPILFGGEVPWGRSEDISQERLYIRSNARARPFNSPMLIGCGALGSAVAEFLVRGGLTKIALIDKGNLEYGNLCRHVLTSASVGRSKSLMLAIHLELTSPSARAHHSFASLPPLTKAHQNSFDEFQKSADILIDASGDDDLLEWFGTLGLRIHVASIWTNSDASIGVGLLAAPGQGPSPSELHVHIRDAIDRGEVLGVSRGVYRGPKLIVPGAGCWHPTFQGSWERISGLAGVLTEWLYGATRGGGTGRCVVFRYHAGTWQLARAWNVPASAKRSSL